MDAGAQGEVWIGPATLMFIISELVEQEAKHQRLTQELDWFILPVLNPDGYAYTMANGNPCKTLH